MKWELSSNADKMSFHYKKEMINPSFISDDVIMVNNKKFKSKVHHQGPNDR
jgi:hypothetical protein